MGNSRVVSSRQEDCCEVQEGEEVWVIIMDLNGVHKEGAKSKKAKKNNYGTDILGMSSDNGIY